MSKWYWRDGSVACDMDEPDWVDKMKAVEEKLRDFDYKVVGRTKLKKYWVSTVWLGLDHSWDGDKPLIFETMVFPHDDLSEQEMERYSTEKEALAGHKRIVDKWRKIEQGNLHPSRHQQVEGNGNDSEQSNMGTAHSGKGRKTREGSSEKETQ